MQPQLRHEAARLVRVRVKVRVRVRVRVGVGVRVRGMARVRVRVRASLDVRQEALASAEGLDEADQARLARIRVRGLGLELG